MGVPNAPDGVTSKWETALQLETEQPGRLVVSLGLREGLRVHPLHLTVLVPLDEALVPQGALGKVHAVARPLLELVRPYDVQEGDEVIERGTQLR